VTLRTLFKVILIFLCNASLKTLQFLYKTLFSKMRTFQNIKEFQHFLWIPIKRCIFQTIANTKKIYLHYVFYSCSSFTSYSIDLTFPDTLYIELINQNLYIIFINYCPEYILKKNLTKIKKHAPST